MAVEKAVRASTTCLIMADHNRYSVDARAAGRMALVRSLAERLGVLFNQVLKDLDTFVFADTMVDEGPGGRTGYRVVSRC